MIDCDIDDQANRERIEQHAEFGRWLMIKRATDEEPAKAAANPLIDLLKRALPHVEAMWHIDSGRVDHSTSCSEAVAKEILEVIEADLRAREQQL